MRKILNIIVDFSLMSFGICVLWMLFFFCPQVRGASRFSTVDITSYQIYSNSYYDLVGATGSGDYGCWDEAYYTQAIGRCNDAYAIAQTNRYNYLPGGALADRECLWYSWGYGDHLWWEADRSKMVKCHVEADLRNISTSQYIRVWLDWPVQYKEQEFVSVAPFNYGKPLIIGTNNTYDPAMFEVAWPSYSEIYNDGNGHALTSHKWMTTGSGSAMIMALVENKETRACSPKEISSLGDPIDTIDGDVHMEVTDIAIPCPGLPLVFSRYYSSALDCNGTLGSRWTHSYNWQLNDTNTVFNGTSNTWKILRPGNLSLFWFLSVTNNVYESPFDNNWSLVLTNQKYRVTVPEGVVYSFDTNGVLETISDLSSNSLVLTYTNSYPNNLLVKVQHNNGQYLSFSNQNNRISRINTPATNFFVSFSYNAVGELTNVIQSVSSNSFSTRYAYDSSTNHCITQKVNAAGIYYSWEYATNSSGQITSKGTRTRVSTNYFDTTFSYADNGQPLTTATIARGDTNQVYLYYYHPVMKRLERVLGPNVVETNLFGTGCGTEYELDDNGNTTKETIFDCYGLGSLSIVKGYDGYHNVTNMGVGFGASVNNYWHYNWDTNLQVMTASADPEGHTTAFEYNNALISKVKIFYDATNSYNTSFSYTTNGLLSAVTNANGHWTQFGYDNYGFRTSSIPQAGPTITYQYSQLGILQKISLPSNISDTNNNMILRDTTFNSDEIGRINSITYLDTNNFNNCLSEYFYYDQLNNVTNHVDTAGRSTRFAYKPTGKLSSVTKTLNGTNLTTSFDYDQQFNTLKITDAKGRSVENYQLDIQDRVIGVTNLEGQSMSVSYFVGDKVKSLTRFDSTTVSNAYNGDGLLSGVTYSDATIQYSYYKNGLLRTASNSLCMVSNNYNNANRLTDVKVTGLISSPQTVSYVFDPAGNTTNITSVAGTQKMTFDEAERMSSITATRANLSPLCFNISYDSVNGLVSAIACTNTGITLSYGRDDLDRITGMSWSTASNGLKSFSYGYNNAGMATSCRFDNGENIAYSYDDLDRLTGETKTDSSGSTIYQEINSFDEVGNRTSKYRDGVTVAYSFSNQNNRLLGWNVTSTNLSTQIDVVGSANTNISANSHWGQLWVSNKVVIPPAVSGTNFWSYDFPMNLGTQKVTAAIRDAAGNTTFITNTVFLSIITNSVYGYNNAGCVTNISYAGAQYSKNIGLTWNNQYQLTAVATNGGAAERNGYDAYGRRAWSWDSSMGTGINSTNFFIYDGVNLVADMDSTGGLKRTYVYAGLDIPLAMTVYTGATAKTYFYLTDRQGTVHAVANEAGNVVEKYRFDAWGRILGVYDGQGLPRMESAIGNRILFQGREYSWKTGFYYFRARWYDPSVGRWLSPDPLGISAGLNFYTFCDDNSMNNTDPDGTETLRAIMVEGTVTLEVPLDPRSPSVIVSGKRVKKDMEFDSEDYLSLHTAEESATDLLITRTGVIIKVGEKATVDLRSHYLYETDECPFAKKSTKTMFRYITRKLRTWFHGKGIFKEKKVYSAPGPRS